MANKIGGNRSWGKSKMQVIVGQTKRKTDIAKERQTKSKPDTSGKRTKKLR